MYSTGAVDGVLPGGDRGLHFEVVVFGNLIGNWSGESEDKVVLRDRKERMRSLS